jgi:hypothetical protein
MMDKFLNTEFEWNLSNCLGTRKVHIKTDRQMAFQKTYLHIRECWKYINLLSESRDKFFHDHSTSSYYVNVIHFPSLSLFIVTSWCHSVLHTCNLFSWHSVYILIGHPSSQPQMLFVPFPVHCSSASLSLKIMSLYSVWEVEWNKSH